MTKIIKPGKYHVVTCPRCECEFMYEDEDIKWGTQRDYYKEVECPCCKNRVDLDMIEKYGK